MSFGNLARRHAVVGDAPEIGWVLARWAHGQGFATEAVRAVIAWGEAELGDRPTVCIIDPEHAASIRVAEKCGYRLVEHATYRGEPVLSFVRDRCHVR
jgi:RimJ/RimL family protein N-acetyltransferase